MKGTGRAKVREEYRFCRGVGKSIEVKVMTDEEITFNDDEVKLISEIISNSIDVGIGVVMELRKGN